MKAVNFLGEMHIPIFFNMGLLTKAYEIIWTQPDNLPGIVQYEGGIHVLTSVFSATQWLYGDAGLK